MYRTPGLVGSGSSAVCWVICQCDNDNVRTAGVQNTWISGF